MTCEYDPELPFAVVENAVNIVARFTNKEDADYWVEQVSGVGEVIDTTPKPKIPEDARHITWGTQSTAYSRRSNGWVGGSAVDTIPESELLELIGDATVTVLVPKEES